LPTQTIAIEHSLPLERLDKFLSAKIPDLSRGAIQRLLGEGHILVDGIVVKPTHRPRKGEVITINIPEATPAAANAEAIALDILYEDDDLLVINKPAGMVVHPGAGQREHTLVNALLHHCGATLSGIGGVARPGIVHRLDKDTSGCIVVAKNDAAHLKLSAQFSSRTVEKTYHAILCGRLPKDSGEIEAPIARHPTQRKRMAVAKRGGRHAWTSYRVLNRFAAASLVEVTLHTGRTHQIRVHFQHLGFPVFGDAVYGKRQTAAVQKATGYAPSRQLLHSARLAFNHPTSGRKLSFEAPDPDDFAVALRSPGA
jgi:23S rRNA pseudouridine1911/1915/1917 synthase